MGKNTINKQLMRFVKGACGGASGNASCNRTAMFGSTAAGMGGCTTRQCCNAIEGAQWYCSGIPSARICSCIGS